MIKCKDCKAFSPQSEHGGVCNFTNFGTVKNDDGCHAGAIINDIYNLGKADTIDEFINLTNDSLERTKPLDAGQSAICTVEFMKEWLKGLAEVIKEQS